MEPQQGIKAKEEKRLHHAQVVKPKVTAYGGGI